VRSADPIDHDAHGGRRPFIPTDPTPSRAPFPEGARGAPMWLFRNWSAGERAMPGR
jgi:hypothetical protein